MARIHVKSGFDLHWVEMETQSSTLADLLFELANKFPGLWFFDGEQREFSLAPNCVVFLNRQAHNDLVNGLDTRLKDNDEVEAYLLPLDGG